MSTLGHTEPRVEWDGVGEVAHLISIRQQLEEFRQLLSSITTAGPLSDVIHDLCGSAMESKRVMSLP